MTYWILLAIAGFLTLVILKVKYDPVYSFIYSAAGSLMWFAVWGYNLNYPPSNIVAGTFVYDLLYYTFLILALGTFFIYVGKRRAQKSETIINAEGNQIVARTYEGGSRISETPEEYRARLKRALRRRRR